MLPPSSVFLPSSPFNHMIWGRKLVTIHILKVPAHCMFVWVLISTLTLKLFYDNVQPHKTSSLCLKCLAIPDDIIPFTGDKALHDLCAKYFVGMKLDFIRMLTYPAQEVHIITT